MLDYHNLKIKHRSLKEKFTEQFSLRIHRSLSWLNKAEQCEDKDSEFIFLWIAFNAVYARDLFNQEYSEKESFRFFLEKVCSLDNQKRIYKVIWETFPKAIRTLLNNQFIYQPFWDYYNQYTLNDWQTGFESSNRRAKQALVEQQPVEILLIIFSRLYTLRNQLLHGGATWNSSLNREQLRDACCIMRALVPIIIDIMLDNSELDWGEVYYPVIKE